VAGVALFGQTGWQTIHPVYLPTTAILSLLIIIAHRSNIGRLLKGNENKFSFSSGNKKGAENHA
jgi:glycerol-3-phosphate acyltransferase PlsY